MEHVVTDPNRAPRPPVTVKLRDGSVYIDQPKYRGSPDMDHIALSPAQAEALILALDVLVTNDIEE